jgi:hypothetical protein
LLAKNIRPLQKPAPHLAPQKKTLSSARERAIPQPNYTL